LLPHPRSRRHMLTHPNILGVGEHVPPARAHPPQCFGNGGARAPCLLVCYAQWRRQTTKLGSAFKVLPGRADRRSLARRRNAETDEVWRGAPLPLPLGSLGAMPPEKKLQKSTLKARIFCMFAN